jgi:hypothetical protein
MLGSGSRVVPAGGQEVDLVSLKVPLRRPRKAEQIRPLNPHDLLAPRIHLYKSLRYGCEPNPVRQSGCFASRLSTARVPTSLETY